MIVNPEILKELRTSAGNSREEKAEEYVDDKKVKITKVIYENKNNFEIRSKVRGKEVYDVHVKVEKGEIEDVSCNCPDYYEHYGTCKHILATAIEFSNNENYVRIFSGDIEQKQTDMQMYNKYQKREEKYREFKQLINNFYPTHEETNESNKTKFIPHSVKIEPKLIYNSYLKTLKMEVKIGDKQLYKIKNLVEFYDRMQKKEFYRYGTKLEFVHEEEAFDENSITLLQYILKYAEIIKYANEATNSYTYYGKTMENSYITISNTGMDELFDVLEGKEVILQKENIEKKILFLKQTPDIKFEIKEENEKEYALIPNIDVYEYDVIEGRKAIYFFMQNILYKCDDNFKETLKLLQTFRENFTNQIVFTK